MGRGEGGEGRGEDDEHRQQMRVPRQLIVFQKERGCPAVQCSGVQSRSVQASKHLFLFLLLSAFWCHCAMFGSDSQARKSYVAGGRKAQHRLPTEACTLRTRGRVESSSSRVG